MFESSRGFAAAAVLCFASSIVACGDAAPEEPSAESADAVSRARFTRLGSGPTDETLAAFYTAGRAFPHAFVGAFRFNKAGPEATSELAREKRIKEVMHRYMCTFFDESIDIGRPTGSRSKRVDTVFRQLDMIDNVFDQDDEQATFRRALELVFDNDDLDVLSGGASGNNTLGEVLGVYDRAHHEIVYFGFTNCGRDD